MQQRNQQFPLIQFQPHSARNDVYVLVVDSGGFTRGPNVSVPPGARVSVLPSGHGVAGQNTDLAIGGDNTNNLIYIAGSTSVPVPVTVSNLNEIYLRATSAGSGYATIFLQDSAVG